MGRTPRKFTAEFKAKVVLDMLTNNKSLSQASREYGIKDSVLSRWRQEFVERAPQLFEQPNNQRSSEERVAELERMVGRLAMQVEAAKKVFGVSSFPTREDD
jgi:transposase